MSKHRRLLVGIVLAVTGVGLVALSYVLALSSPSTSPPPTELVLPQPSPTWATLPTRAPDAGAASVAAPDLLPLRRALLMGDLTTASLIWDALKDSPIAQSSEAQRAGARLALMQGDLAEAQILAWHAIGFAPEDAQAWSLLGIVLRRSGSTAGAEQALAIAESLDPGLADALFDDRWRAAVTAPNTGGLTTLAEGYSLRHPDSLLESHYRGYALIVAGEPLAAIELLVSAIQDRPGVPALVWYTLGEAYLARGGHEEAAIALEVAATKVAQGDQSLYYVTDAPIAELNARLAHAYLFTKRCAEAESIFRRLASDQPEFGSWVEQAVVCQTPTPTLTPWIPDQQVTATPSP